MTFHCTWDKTEIPSQDIMGHGLVLLSSLILGYSHMVSYSLVSNPLSYVGLSHVLSVDIHVPLIYMADSWLSDFSLNVPCPGLPQYLYHATFIISLTEPLAVFIHFFASFKFFATLLVPIFQLGDKGRHHVLFTS